MSNSLFRGKNATLAVPLLLSSLFVHPESGIAAKVVAAIDVNTTANEIYRHNFPDTPLWSKTIEVSLVVG